MVNVDRRMFLQGAAAAAVAASMPGAVQGEATTKKMIGIQVGAVSFFDEVTHDESVPVFAPCPPRPYPVRQSFNLGSCAQPGLFFYRRRC